MSKRSMIRIDDERCDGCGACIPNCPEGALQVIEGKARLVGDLFCDGLGACLGQCPRGALSVEEREAAPYDERRVMENIIPQGEGVIRAHLRHLLNHGAEAHYQTAVTVLLEKGIAPPEEKAAGCGAHGRACPGSTPLDLRAREANPVEPARSSPRASELRTWPVQLHLVPASAPFLEEADLLIAADCAGFASPDLHTQFLRRRVLLVGCPKLDDRGAYLEKLTAIFSQRRIRSVLVLYMEVPCCYGLVALVREAVERSGRAVPWAAQKIGIRGEALPATRE